MKLNILFENRERKRIPNPLNGGVVPESVYNFMTFIGEVETEYQHALINPKIPYRPEHSRIAMNSIYSLGIITEFPIKKLISMEPDYDKEYSKSISNPKPAFVYLYKGKYYINDGNHRVIAAHNSGKTTTKVNIVDVDDIISKTHELNSN